MPQKDACVSVHALLKNGFIENLRKVNQFNEVQMKKRASARRESPSDHVSVAFMKCVVA